MRMSLCFLVLLVFVLVPLVGAVLYFVLRPRQKRLEGVAPAPMLPPPVAGPAAAASWESQAGSVPQELAANEVLEMYHSSEPPVFLDVREDVERRESGYIPGSIHIPMHEVQGRMDELEPERAIIVYCASGMRSMDVGAFLLEQGFHDVSNLNGGLAKWTGPIERPT